MRRPSQPGTSTAARPKASRIRAIAAVAGASRRNGRQTTRPRSWQGRRDQRTAGEDLHHRTRGSRRLVSACRGMRACCRQVFVEARSREPAVRSRGEYSPPESPFRSTNPGFDAMKRDKETTTTLTLVPATAGRSRINLSDCRQGRGGWSYIRRVCAKTEGLCRAGIRNRSDFR